MSFGDGSGAKPWLRNALRFIATDSVSENVTRVLQRAQGGGHGAAEQNVRATHESSLRNLRQAIGVFEWARV